MSLDFSLLAVRRTCVFETNITHNLAQMADEAGVYSQLWRPDENGNPTAGELVGPLTKAIADMEARPEHYKQFNPPNGWGDYDTFLGWLHEVRDMCEEFPDAEIEASR